MSNTRTLAEALRALLPSDVTVLDAPQAATALGTVKALRGVLDSFEASVTSHLKALHRRGESASAADLHTRNGGVSSREALLKERRADALEQAPSLADKLAAGEVTASHADALADASCRLDDDLRSELFDRQESLAADAARTTPEEFRKNCKDLIAFLERERGIDRDRQQRNETRLTKKIDRDGMYTINARLHPELGHLVFNALDAETAKVVGPGGGRTVHRTHIAAEAPGNLITGGHQATRPGEAEIRVHVAPATLIDDADEGVCEFDDGTPAPVESVRRMLCNGRIVPIIIDSNGVTLNIGREQRLANRTQRRALRAMYRTCAFHGCDVTFNRCEIHHLHPYELGGNTDLANLLPLCSRHHHVIHHDGWHLELDTDRTLTIWQPDGSVYATVPILQRRIVNTPESANSEPGHSPPPGQLALLAS